MPIAEESAKAAPRNPLSAPFFSPPGRGSLCFLRPQISGFFGEMHPTGGHKREPNPEIRPMWTKMLGSVVVCALLLRHFTLMQDTSNLMGSMAILRLDIEFYARICCS